VYRIVWRRESRDGRLTDDSVIGTNGDGISDSDERNIFAHPVYFHDLEFYSNSTNAVIAGNYFGVGRRGLAAPLSTNVAPDFAELSSGGVAWDPMVTASAMIGGERDHQPARSRFVVAGEHADRNAENKLVNNNFRAIPSRLRTRMRDYVTYYAAYLQV